MHALLVPCWEDIICRKTVWRLQRALETKGKLKVFLLSRKRKIKKDARETERREKPEGQE